MTFVTAICLKILCETTTVKVQRSSLSSERGKRNKDITKIVCSTKLQVDKVLCKKATLRISVRNKEGIY